MIKNRDELEEFYNSLNEEYEGYIQMSDRRIENIFESSSKLPKWDDLHQDNNFILELALFDKNTNRSILIREANGSWSVIDRVLNDNEPIDSFYTLRENLKMKMAQIWEEEDDEFCLGMRVLEFKYLLFAGFKRIRDDKSTI